MANSNARATYSSLSKIEKENSNHFSNNSMNHYDESKWSEPNALVSKSSNQRIVYQVPSEADGFFDEGYDSSDDANNHSIVPSNMPPEVNLKNVLSGMVAILTGQNKVPVITTSKEVPTSNVSFLGSGKNGDSFIDSSVYTPSAPPLFELSGTDYSSYKEVLEAEPPEWLPDSSTIACMQCTAPFTALTRGRHHCRFCGGIFCRICTKGRCLLPVRFREKNPQRVCDSCYDRLDPLQGVLINTISNAVQVAKHDVMDWTCARGWINLPIGLSMEHEIYKASNTLRNYCQIGGELMDFIIVLHNTKAVKTFCSRMHFSLGAGCSAAAGPVGRVLEADIRAGDRGSGMCYTYSCSKGAFVGVSLEGNVVATRMDTNLRFYGDPYLTTSDILLGMVDRPKAAQPLYTSLQELYSSLCY
ncbi:PREDICTED: uncharacterized protein LOC109362303 isoform X2 [Lupinus angustifolius]|uniref:uncharacterized protein LOC109362303 isoform X2 n=1 Tax=Lupinus angustifolius TaxID=3871 RepID=UPI00092EB8F9|nr:PREDICTED: uncharacterized protein LOC109362303 isoform X2 [Lupinus angustifolius]